MIRVLLDINVVLDLFLKREPWFGEAAAVFEANHRGEIRVHLSAASLPTIYYLVRRNAGREKADRVVAETLEFFEILPVNRQTLEFARVLVGTDYEDNVQLASAQIAGLDAVVTRDPGGFAGSTMAILAPGEMIARVAKGG